MLNNERPRLNAQFSRSAVLFGEPAKDARKALDKILRDFAAKRKAPAEEATKFVRRFSPVGPCLTLGELVKETKECYFYRCRYDDGVVRRISKSKAHVEPCRSCRDHDDTVYPDGYQD